MRLATWNVNSLKARLPRVLELLETRAPDVLAVQETKGRADAFPHAELAAAGYHAVEHSAGRWAGVALIVPSTSPLADPRRGLEGEPAPEEARWIEATVAGLRVASVYVPNGRAPGSEAFAGKLAFLDALVARVRAGGLDVLMGDLNVTRVDLDVYDPEAFAGATHVTPHERSRLEAALAAGLSDAYRAVHPATVQYTWWDYRQGHFHRNLGLRIDYVLLGPATAGRLRECAIERDFRKGRGPSDHVPLLAELSD